MFSLLPSLAGMVCPSLRTALMLRITSRDFHFALSEGFLLSLTLAEGLAPANVVRRFALRVAQNDRLLVEAAICGRSMAQSMLATVEGFGPYLCPHPRYFGDHERVLEQTRITLNLLALMPCSEMVLSSVALRRMARCNEEVGACLPIFYLASSRMADAADDASFLLEMMRCPCGRLGSDYFRTT